MDRQRMFTVVIIIITVSCIALCMIHLNGWSLDFSDRQLVLIVSDSMEGDPTDFEIDTIEKDSLIMVKSIDSDEERSRLKVGDVIQFNYFGILDHHRIITNDSEARTIQTKGDNSDAVENVPYWNVLGKVVGKDHLAGLAVSFIRSYWLMLIPAIIASIAALELYKDRKKRDEA